MKDDNQNKKFEFDQNPFEVPVLIDKEFFENKEKRWTLAAGAMIFAHNKILLNRSDYSDLWSLPGGVVAYNETPANCVERKVGIELNLDAEVFDQEPYIFQVFLENDEIINQITLLHFLVKIKGKNTIRMGGDVIDYKWFPITSHFNDAYPNVKAAVSHFMKI